MSHPEVASAAHEPEADEAPSGDPSIPTGPPNVARTQRRGRGILVVALVAVSSLSVLISSVSIWAHRTLFNTDQWVATVGPLAQNPAVVSSVSQNVTKLVNDAVTPEQRIAKVLPASLGALAAPIAQGFDQIVARAVSGILNSQQFAAFWTAANRALQPRFAAILLGNSTAHLKTANGTVQLNLLPLVSKVLTAVQHSAPSLLTTNGPIPTITSTTPVDEARSELGHALGRTLAPGFGTVTLLKSGQLAAAQRLVKVFNTLIIALVALTVVVMVLAVVVARRKRRTVVAIGLGVVVAMALAIGLTRVITNVVVSAITNPQNRGAMRATLGTILGDLNSISLALIGAGLLVVVAVFLTGPSSVAQLVRRQGVAVGRALIGDRRSGQSVPQAFVWVGRYRTTLTLFGLGLAVLLIATVVTGVAGLLATLLAFAAYATLLAWVGRHGGTEDGHA